MHIKERGKYCSSDLSEGKIREKSVKKGQRERKKEKEKTMHIKERGKYCACDLPEGKIREKRVSGKVEGEQRKKEK